MENPFLVFISSVISGMAAERQAGEAAIRSIPLSRPWVFEHSPASSLPLADSYLSKVRECDIFVLLLREMITDPVKLEVNTAQETGKPLLVFLGRGATPDVSTYVRSLGVKYATYADPADLAGQVAEAVADELIRGYRQHQVPRTDLTPLGDFLDAVAQGQNKIQIGGDQIVANGPVATHGSAIRTGGGTIVAGKGNVVITGKVGRDVDVMLPGSTKVVKGGAAKAARQAEARALRRYLEHLHRYCQALPLATLGGDETSDQDVTLDQVYIDLETTTPVSLSESDKKSRRWKFYPSPGEHGDSSRPVTALEAAASAPRLVLLGDPGAGKSTFARMVLAQLSAARLGPAKPPPGMSLKLLPILITLRDLVPSLSALDLRGLPEDRQQTTLAAAVRDQALADLARLEAAGCANALCSALVDGQCLLVFDGLDEAPQALRERVRAAVAAVIRQYAPKRIMVTCRVRSYVGDAVLAGFQSFTLAPFDEDRIRRFVRAWYNEQVRLGRLDAVQAESRIADLAGAALAPGLRELAGNPMLLTTMAIIHQKEIGLPRERVRLYSLGVDVLLRRWQKRKTGEQGIAPSAELSEFLKADLRLRSTMERLAYEAHRRGLRPGEAAELTRGDALELLEEHRYLGSAGLADEFLDYVDQRAGLLVGRGGDPGRPTTYGFPHRTFQEYLAGCYLAGQRDMARTYFAHATEADWRLAALLGAEELYFNLRRPNELLDLAYRLCPADVPAGQQAQRAILWSGAMAVMAGRDAILHDADSPDGGRSYLQRLAPRLVDLLGSKMPAPERADAGRLLSKLGDSRREVTTLDEMEFCLAPGGLFWLGSDKKRDPVSDDNERPNQQVDLPLYTISRYPVTNAQFAGFVAAGGYATPRFWGEAQQSRVWDKGIVSGGIEHEPRVGPYDYGEPFNLSNHPVVGVTWYEGLAFTRWLTELWTTKGLLPPDWAITLPTEAQWEKAARGGLEIPATPVILAISQDLESVGRGTTQANPDPQRIYPWQGKLTPDHANYVEARVGVTSAVGIFPQGASPYGALDMSGNVWEWTSSCYRGYLYRTDDGREDPGASSARVLRGGAFLYHARLVRCASRYWYDPNYRFWGIGFRVVASPIIHDSGS